MEQSKIIGAPGIIHSDIKISGIVQAFVRRADCPDVNKLVFEDKNAIGSGLKTYLRDVMHSSTDLALDNLRATQSTTGTAGDDGITLSNADGSQGTGVFEGIMASAVHPSDPSGSFYRQWQGIWQEPGATNTIKSAWIGYNLTPGPASGAFATTYASEDISPDIILLLNDILTINWKISIG